MIHFLTFTAAVGARLGGINRRFVCLAIGVLISVSACSSAEHGVGRSHHTGQGFRNLHTTDDKTFFDFVTWQWQRLSKNIPSPEAYHFPIAGTDPGFLRREHHSAAITWIGHATLLLQSNRLNILTDPHFSERASPVQWAGPKRAVPPGIPLDDLPEIDVVLISHNHYDHLDEESVMKLFWRPGGDRTVFIVPLKLKEWFTRRGIERVVELDWWDEHRTGKATVIAVPVQHWSKRGLFDGFETLWAGWVIRVDGRQYLIVCDAGYSLEYSEIRRRLGPSDLAALPIGAYEPRWFMKKYHMTPEEAVQAHIDAGAGTSVGIHWGTFVLTDEPLDEPPVRLGKALKEKEISPDRFLVLQHGETIIFDSGGIRRMAGTGNAEAASAHVPAIP
ncbi:MAG: MBL fold metallo-hydrolase [Nitrospirota bacterium]|nr:MBL fold metallo-hydrolase [Nitrospirota bacterium]